MYFRLIGIKEKNGNKYDLDLLVGGGDEDFIRSFLANLGIVIVSINEYKDDPYAFGNIIANVIYSEVNVQLITHGEDLSQSVLFFVYLGLRPWSVNFVNDPVSEDEMNNLINSAILTAEKEEEKTKVDEKVEELKEKKKYEETGITEGLKIINANIDHIEQVLKAGQGILSGTEIRDLRNYSDEMKKIRLGTNFNKMASLVLESHNLLKQAENEIFEANNGNKFLIDQNSSVTNIDVLREYFDSNRIAETAKFQPSFLSASESLSNVFGKKSIFLKLLGHDIHNSLENYTFDEFFDTMIKLIEFIVLVIIVVVSLLWLLGQGIGIKQFSLYLLPAMGWLGLLLYFFHSLKLKGVISNIAGFLVMVLLYWQGLKLLLNTFAI